MKKVFQTDFSFETGNCFSACIASLLELNIEDVPCFMGKGKSWFTGCNDWLATRGLAYVEFQWKDVSARWFCDPGAQMLVIATGTSPRDGTKLHCVVAELLRAEKDIPVTIRVNFLHDPHPSQLFIDTKLKNKTGEIINEQVGSIGFLVPLNPGAKNA